MCGCQDQSHMCKYMYALKMNIDKQFQHLKDLLPTANNPSDHNIGVPVEDPCTPEASTSNVEELQQPLVIEQSPRIQHVTIVNVMIEKHKSIHHFFIVDMLSNLTPGHSMT
jgi:hypothetical protein